jgi:hypothetical protein
MSDLLESPPPLWAQFSEGNLSDFGLRERPTAELLVAGIEKAGREGRIPAWRDKSRTRYFEPEKQSGSWLTCCPAHDDHNPSFVASDGIDESGKPRLLVYCRSGCDQDKVIDALDTLGLWNWTPDTIDDLKAAAGASAAGPVKKQRRRSARQSSQSRLAHRRLHVLTPNLARSRYGTSTATLMASLSFTSADLNRTRRGRRTTQTRRRARSKSRITKPSGHSLSASLRTDRRGGIGSSPHRTFHSTKQTSLPRTRRPG